MAVVALVTSGDRRIYALPGQLADVEKVYGGEYGDEEDQDDVPSSMRLPNELLQQIYSYLSPVDFNSARHACRTWYLASLDRELLTNMLKQGGWWSSMLSILAPMRTTPASNLGREDIMSKWIARECNLLSPQKSAFVEVSHTDFSAIVPGSVPGDLRGAMSFTVSLCGKFLMAAHGRVVYIYELNHVCFPERLLWALPFRRRQGMPLGLLRPATKILCPRRVISCSMDTSAERYSVAFLMEGRVGMVCDITTERTGTSSLASTPQSTELPVITSGSGSVSGVSSASTSLASSSQCACHEHLPSLPMPPEEGPRSVYRNICHPDDPPRSVAICPQRKCVAFGCSAGIELHWVDALTGQDLSRWFPLTSPSDFLYFLPPRRGVDTPRKLRLISSAAGLGNPMELLDGIIHGFSTSLLGSGSTAVVSCFDAEPWYMRHSRGISVEAGGPSREVDVDNDESLLSRNVPRDSPLRRLVAASADHFRAVPLSDGYHILFTDPRTGCLCLGTDAPVGSLTRLLRKVWFRPPSQAYSPMPLLYVAGSDTRHGVRVVATFAARPQHDGTPLDERTFPSDTGATEDSSQQLIVFYTVPPDVFHDIRRADAEARSAGYRPTESRRFGQQELTYGHINLVSDPFGQDSHYPVEVYGQVVATCGNLTEIALNSSPDLIIWAFAAEGWAKTWALNNGKNEPIINSAAHRDGSVRQADSDGDVVVAGPAPPETPSELSSLDFNLFDGSPISNSDREPTVLGPYSHGRRCHMLGEIWDMQGGEADAMRIDLVEEIGSITRVDIELLS
ncbi:F-box domain-containing protein [Trichoderma harzianum]|uniref:F-box domain-containing protein n=1 Tax=Trichoderma harzianum TaxID=5544 RepID=A0A0F9ZLH1_TRIHA|nr:F-box domain-containing protein [Trichoderma harzianum]